MTQLRIKEAQVWCDFYKELWQSGEKDFQTEVMLPDSENFRTPNNDLRGWTFPCPTFGIPKRLQIDTSHLKPIPKRLINRMIDIPWRSCQIDLNGAHFYTLVKRNDGTIVELNDFGFSRRKRKPEDLIKYKDTKEFVKCFTDPKCKYGVYVINPSPLTDLISKESAF